ncbi:hypothetical protein GCM10029976_060220 [Kribbella albertanoniae]
MCRGRRRSRNREQYAVRDHSGRTNLQRLYGRPRRPGLRAAPGKGLAGIDPALVNSPAFKTALAACKDLIPGGVRGSEAPADQTKYLEFAKCMRSNGLPDFPDPKPGSKDGMFGGGAVDRNNPAFKKAAEACSHVLG